MNSKKRKANEIFSAAEMSEECKKKMLREEDVKSMHEEKSELVNDKKYPNMCPLFRPKKFTNHEKTNCAKVTQYVQVTIWELSQKVKAEVAAKHRKADE